MMEPADLWKRHDLSECRRAELVAPRGCPCPAKDGFGIGGIVDCCTITTGPVSDAVHSRWNHYGSGNSRLTLPIQAFNIMDSAISLRWHRDDLFRAPSVPLSSSGTIVRTRRFSVADQIPRRRVPRKGFAHLLCHPIRARMCGDSQQCSMRRRSWRQHDEDKQNGKPGRRDHKEIDRNRDCPRDVVEERPPGLRRRLRMPHHVSRYSRLADIDAQLQ